MMRRIRRNKILAVGVILMTMQHTIVPIVYAGQMNQSSVEEQNKNSSEEDQNYASSESYPSVIEDIESEEGAESLILENDYTIRLDGIIRRQQKELFLPFAEWNQVKLDIEEVYVKKGTTLKMGDPILKISTESMRKLLEYYDNQVSTARTMLKKKEEQYELEKKNAEYEKEYEKKTGENASAQKNSQLDSLKASVSNLEKYLNRAENELDTYNKKLNDDTYYKEYGIEDMAQAVTEGKNLMEDAQRTLSKMQSESKDEATLNLLKDLVKQAENNYQTLKKQYDKLLFNYGKEVSEAQIKRSALQSSLASLQEQYDEQKTRSEQKILEINKAYDLAVLASRQADQRYKMKLQALEDELETAKKTLEKWTQQREEIYRMRDGIINAKQDMAVTSFAYQNGDEIKEEEPILTYTDNQAVIVTVQVPQKQITEWNIGDTVKVKIGEKDRLMTGTVALMQLQKAEKTENNEIKYNAVIIIEQEIKVEEEMRAVVLCGPLLQATKLMEKASEESPSQTVASFSQELLPSSGPSLQEPQPSSIQPLQEPLGGINE